MGGLALDGTAVTVDQAVAVDALGDLVFTPGANGNGDAYASFTFKVSDGVSQSVVYTVTVNVTAVNDAATGKPAISGTAQVGRTLMASTSGIADVDGKTKADAGDVGFVWSYQWVRVASDMTEADITGATSDTYVLASDDNGKQVKVKASFTDDGDTAEGPLTSDAYPSGATVGTNAAPTSADKTVTTNEDTAYTFGAGDFVFADTDTGDALSSVKVVTLPGVGGLALDGTAVTVDALADLVFTPGANGNGDAYASFTFKVSDGVSQSVVYTVTVNVTAVNDAATGKPAISGTAQVGRTLMASTSGIADVDGKTKADAAETGFVWSYQWVRVDGSNETDITGETSSTYTLAAADNGKQVKVKASFTDDGGTAEGPLTSDAYPSGIAQGKLRLTGGQVEHEGRLHEGRLEMYYSERWGTICDDYWTRTDADVACRALGYPGGSVEDAGRFRKAYFGKGTGPIWLDDVQCEGEESNLLLCPRSGDIAVGVHNCGHKEDVGVRCDTTPAPRVVSTELSAPPGGNGRYDVGETLEVTLVWSEAVAVETPAGALAPKVWVLYDEAAMVRAVYARGDGDGAHGVHPHAERG